MGSCKEKGKYKTIVSSALRNSEFVKVMLLGKDYETKLENLNIHVDDALDSHIFSHLFVDDTVTKTENYIFYDVVIPKFSSNLKKPKILVYAICHRDILDNLENLSKDIRKTYPGNRMDKLSQIVEEILCEDDEVANSFGIGALDCTDLSIYNSENFYGVVLTFEVHNFR